MKLCVVGRGKVGRALARAARRASLEVSHTRGRAPSARALRGASLALLCVPDAAIGPSGLAVARLAPQLAIAHVAGGRGPEALDEARALGAAVGAMHPLVSFADPRRPPKLEGATFLIDGAPRAVKEARALARALGARPLIRAAHGPAYHAAAALTANGAAALAFHAVETLSALGFERAGAEEGVARLLESVAANVRRLGVPAALTGPIARGDDASVRAHRAALAEAQPAALAAYDAVGPAILSCARAAGLEGARAAAVAEALAAPTPTTRLTPPRRPARRR